jgi:putative Mn2+ efflux pump MntP
LFINKFLLIFVEILKQHSKDIKMKPKTKTQRVLTLMHVIAWLAFVGLAIQAGAMIVSFFVSLHNPVAAKNLYIGLSFSEVMRYDITTYSAIVICIIGLTIVKAYIAYLTIKIFSTIDLSSPFSMQVAQAIEKISIVAFVAGLVAIVAGSYSDWLTSTGVKTQYNWAAGEFLMLAGIVFIVAQVFKRGIELQEENEMTI